MPSSPYYAENYAGIIDTGLTMASSPFQALYIVYYKYEFQLRRYVIMDQFLEFCFHRLCQSSSTGFESRSF